MSACWIKSCWLTPKYPNCEKRYRAVCSIRSLTLCIYHRLLPAMRSLGRSKDCDAHDLFIVFFYVRQDIIKCYQSRNGIEEISWADAAHWGERNWRKRRRASNRGLSKPGSSFFPSVDFTAFASRTLCAGRIRPCTPFICTLQTLKQSLMLSWIP